MCQNVSDRNPVCTCGSYEPSCLKVTAGAILSAGTCIKMQNIWSVVPSRLSIKSYDGVLVTLRYSGLLG